MSPYRSDIDGLRAICIVSVVMFHAGFHDWAGGFVGVDVFFVISGYLITSLIGRQIAFGEFSLAGFYERRIRRLLAASIPVVLFTTLFALAFYMADDLVAYCKSLIAFAGYSSNWFFLSQTGYFATPPETSPLLHTWSLAVEEQFYLVFPALLVALLRFPRRAVWVLAAIGALSLAYAQVEISRGFPDWAFFGSISRFWELLAGAVLAMVPAVIERTARFALPMRAAGLAMIVASVFLYGPATPFPGVAALLPVGGALLVIAAAPEARDPLWRLLTSGPMVYLGKISYALYLWHWPVFGAARTVLLSYSDVYIVVGIALSVALASLSYHLLEQPVRARRSLPRGRHMAVLLGSASTVAVAVGLAGWSADGWPARFPPGVETTIARASRMPELPAQCAERPDMADGILCQLGTAKTGTSDLLLWGDSHAHSMVPVIRKYAETHGLSLALAERDGCPPFFDTGRERRARRGIDRGCAPFNSAVRDFIRDNDVRAVVLAARWSFYAEGSVALIDLKGGDNAGTPEQRFERALARTLDELRGRAVVIVEQAPEQVVRAENAYIVLSRAGRSVADLSVSRARHEKVQRGVVAAMDRLAVRDNMLRIDPARALCRGGRCRIEEDGKLLYRDQHHLSIDGSLFLYPLIEEELDRFRGLPPQARQEPAGMASGPPR
jgi:peptidoglycan/LPS O-acetylase OafA/YrhL